MAPVQLNIVCFRYRTADANKVNGEIVVDIQEFGHRGTVDHDCSTASLRSARRSSTTAPTSAISMR